MQTPWNVKIMISAPDSRTVCSNFHVMLSGAEAVLSSADFYSNICWKIEKCNYPPSWVILLLIYTFVYFTYICYPNSAHNVDILRKISPFEL
jgi:hypothetical protein